MDLSHIDPDGRVRMVDVGGKPALRRTARAQGRITLQAETVRLLRGRLLAKGDAIAAATIAGIAAAKRTAELIPLCHTLALDHAGLTLDVTDTGVVITAETACTGPTGAEMEALTAVAAAALTVYDMCKAVDRAMVIGEIRLLEKTKAPAGDGA